MSVLGIIKPLSLGSILGVAFSLSFSSMAYAQVSKEHKVKAAIIYNLARFSEWSLTPSTKEASSFSMCVMANDVMRDALATLKGKEISGRRVEIMPLLSHGANTSKCHILYVSGKALQNFDLQKLAENGVLTISDTENFLSAGGGITVLRTHNTLGFSINRTVMLKANIRPSSKILRLAKEVR
ncbi:MAG: YfiR family protein [Hellea sp.]